MNILVVAATSIEIEPLVIFLHENWAFDEAEKIFSKDKIKLKILVTGVGLPQTIYSLTDHLNHQNYTLIINAGIAGSFDKKINLGEVVLVEKDRFADLGVEDKDSTFMDVYQMGLEERKTYNSGWLINEGLKEYHFLKKVRGISVNKVHGAERSIQNIYDLYRPDIESMEGAGVHLVGLKKNIPFMQIRSISNYVEPRNKDNWNIGLAIKNLNNTLIQLIQVF